jgi:D-glycero-D-manno-heptose 1,7-bisphosphate phosphatase
MISQAIIIAGGRGERLLPITKFLPKALTPINGTPMIDLIINQLEDLNFSKVHVLAGYHGDLVEKYLSSSNISRRIEISVSITDSELTPRERVLTLEGQITGPFLLLYCDNYVESHSVVKNFLNNGSNFGFIVELRKQGNVRIDSHQRSFYNSKSRNSEFPFIELGYIKLDSPSFFNALNQADSMQDALELLTNTHEFTSISAIGSNRSISNLDRFLALNENINIIMLDRDGILNKKMAKREYLAKFSDYQPIKEIRAELKRLAAQGNYFVIITNQPGIATSEVSEIFLDEFHRVLVHELFLEGIFVLAIYHCPHHWDDGCKCRKPEPGMLVNAMNDFHINPTKTAFLGDDLRDQQAAQAAGVAGYVLSEESVGDNHYLDIRVAVDAIIEQFHH